MKYKIDLKHDEYKYIAVSNVLWKDDNQYLTMFFGSREDLFVENTFLKWFKQLPHAQYLWIALCSATESTHLHILYLE